MRLSAWRPGKLFLQGDRPVIQFLVHDTHDTVAVAVVDVKAGESLEGRDLSNNGKLSAKSLNDIPLGHKIALKDFKVGDAVIKYGCDIGKVVKPIKAGEHVHTHNLKTKRWA
jgi:(2R)-sulfolactate sulfo-lyase subunit alpha